MSLDYTLVKEYRDINEQMKVLEGRKKQLNSLFKSQLGTSRNDYVVKDLVVRIIPINKSKIDEFRAISFIKLAKQGKIEDMVETGVPEEEAIEYVEEIFKGSIKTVETLDQEVLKNLFFKGILVPEEFTEECLIPNIVPTLRVDLVSEVANE